MPFRFRSVGALAALAWMGVVGFGGCGLDLNGLDASGEGGSDATTDGSGPHGDGAPGSCTDGVEDGSETGIDCGGPQCLARCPTGGGCTTGSDCQSMVCDPTAFHCEAPTCTDGVKNGAETDVDCGGSACSPCGNQRGCDVASDCVSMLCAMMKCIAPSCTDHVKDGNETDVDCGGPDCSPCATGDGCLAMRDCVSGDYCASTMTCAAQGALGAMCAADDACGSGNCVDDVCCDTPAASCDGCKACNLAGSVGTCSNVPLGSDPHAACTANAAMCEAETCQGDGTCALTDGTSCAPTTCTAATQTSYACAAMVCVPTTLSCAPYTCSGTACAGTCASDIDCSGGDYCNASGDCVPEKVVGSACDEATDCRSSPCAECLGSGGCVDGYCCNTACTGACQTCAMAGGSTENGQCANASTGSAGQPTCAPYVCNGTGATCPAGCASDSACATADYCDENGHCVAVKASGASCNTAAGSDCKVAGCRECGALTCGGGHCM